MLVLAHENLWSGHLGVTNTCNHGLKHLFGPVSRQRGGIAVRSLHWERNAIPLLLSKPSDISAFVTPGHFLQYDVMAFGLRNAPATFQHLAHLPTLSVSNCNLCLDDVVVYSHLWTVYVSKASLKLNLAKCEFGMAAVTNL